MPPISFVPCYAETIRAPAALQADLRGIDHIVPLSVPLTWLGFCVTGVETLLDSMTLHQLAAFLTNPDTKHPSFPVVDAERRVLRIVDPPTVLRWRRAGWHRRTTARESLANTKITLAFSDEYLDGLADRMMNADLLRVRSRLQAEERQRVVLYRVR